MSKRAFLWGTLAVGATVFLLLIWKGPWWADSKHLGPALTPGAAAVVTGFRTALVAVGAGAIAATSLYYTDRNYRHSRDLLEHMRDKDNEQAALTREGQVIDRYAAAIKMLSSESSTGKLGGIYALERIMHDSERDHLTIAEVLAAFVRANAQLDNTAQIEAISKRFPEFLSAALTALGRRPKREEPFRIDLRKTYLLKCDLKDSNLRRVRLGNAVLDKADMRRAVLSGGWLKGVSLKNAYMGQADLEGAILENANLTEANLSGANISKADLTKANLTGANLQGANLSGAKLDGAVLAGANLQGANIAGAELSQCRGLTVSQLTSAEGFKQAEIPQNLE
ncbi:Pentapeptide repeat-containing protein [Streptomyces sp. 3213]|uniref:pentapeptide repeat-containing protein n=1 Tax=Streptomyces sp. 3213.3 TaxID=1855348 RepID=UPI000897CECF|nr:pentapeptide repeat-containing protein [Streptomyces sp. 3213.3]SED69438.1 Pentapeptide repeat-containing protein [Streptomyces sp. 3213] [Streptomyces sp. 3213.3]